MISVTENVGNGRQVEIFRPDVQGKRPVVFYVHGGAWHKKDAHTSASLCKSLAEQGYVCVSTSYSLTSLNDTQFKVVVATVLGILLALSLAAQTLKQMLFLSVIITLVLIVFLVVWSSSPPEPINHPTHIQDVARSFRWTVENVAKFGGDPLQIFVAGHSAGGHLVSLLSTNESFLVQEGLTLDHIKGVIAVSGVYSDVRLKEMTGGTELLRRVFGNRENYFDAFPIYNITARTPPTLLLNAGMDIGLKRHSFDYFHALRQSGVFVEIAYFEDCTHLDIHKKWGKGQSNGAITGTVHTFVQKRLHHLSNLART